MTALRVTPPASFAAIWLALRPFSPHLLQLFDAVFRPGQFLVGVWLFVLLAQG
jgi:hypothetical protein